MGLFSVDWTTDNPRKARRAIDSLKDIFDEEELFRIAVKAPLDDVAVAACARLSVGNERLFTLATIGNRAPVIDMAIGLLSLADNGQERLKDVAVCKEAHDYSRIKATSIVTEHYLLGVIARDSPTEDARKLAQNIIDRSNAAADRRTPPQVLAQLVDSPELFIRKKLAENTSTPADALMVLAKNTFTDVRNAVAQNDSADSSVLALLAEDKEMSVRKTVAANVNTPNQVLKALSRDACPSVRLAVAANTSTSADIILQLADDEFGSVSLAAQSNPTFPVDKLAEFALNGNANDRLAAASNPSTPPSLLAALVQGPEPELQICISVAENPSAPPEALSILAESDDEDVLIAVAENPSLTLETIKVLYRRLAEDEDLDWIKEELAENEQTPPEILDEIADGEYPYRLILVGGNRSAWPETLRRIALEDEDAASAVAENPSAPQDLLVELSTRKNPDYIYELASNPSTPKEILASFMKHHFSSIRLSLAKNPSTPIETILELSEDGDERVREAALIRLSQAGSKELRGVSTAQPGASAQGNVSDNNVNKKDKFSKLLGKDPK